MSLRNVFSRCLRHPPETESRNSNNQIRCSKCKMPKPKQRCLTLDSLGVPSFGVASARVDLGGALLGWFDSG